jgi:hypothetical protein
MHLHLQELEGRWYINQSNFPMWLKGDKTQPTFNYTVATRKGKRGLEDVVQYQKNGRSKRIRGFDQVLNAANTDFLWRGKGLLSLLSSAWVILYVSPQRDWAVIAFKKPYLHRRGTM